jgi:plastocyanin
LIVWAAGAAGFLFGLGVLVLSVTMALSMDDGITNGRGSPSPQTPFVATDLTVDVAIRDFDYHPRDLIITVGTSVTWTNYDNADHNSTDRGRTWDTGILQRGQSMTLRFDEPGTYQYFCIYHYDMNAARLVVR